MKNNKLQNIVFYGTGVAYSNVYAAALKDCYRNEIKPIKTGDKMKELILIIMMIGFGTIMKVQTIAAQPSVTSARYKLPANQVIDIADVPVVVLNGLNNTYTYNEIEKVEVCTYNDADIYKFTLLIGNDKEKVVYFSPVGVEI